jgi:hypothetical protein
MTPPTHAAGDPSRYMVDPAHGGVLTHYAVPEQVIAEGEQQGFEFLRLAGDDYPRRSRAYVTDWYYYVFRKLKHR